MNSIQKTVIALMVALLPAAASAQLISVQQGTGRATTQKVKKAKKAQKSQDAKDVLETPETNLLKSDDGVKATVQADVVSRYIWRGLELAGFSLQPQVSVSWRGLSLTAEGSTSLDKDGYRDLDLTLGYQLGPVNIGVTDYWSTGVDSENRYLYYDQHKGAHIFEGNLGFTCKYFSLQGYCMFWGNDFKVPADSRVSNGDERAYSTYIELGIPFKLGSCDWQLTVGGTPMESGGTWEVQAHETLLGLEDIPVRVYEYAEGPACCVASLRCTKELKLGSLRLPVFAEFNSNPYLSKASMIFGLSIIPF